MSSVYYDLDDENKKLKKDNQYFLAISKAIKAVDYMEKEDLNDVSSIWPLEELIRYLPNFKEAKSESKFVISKVKDNDEIGKEWIESLEQIPKKSDMLDKILNYLKEHPGYKQSELWSVLDIDGREGANLIHYAEQLDVIEIEKENGENLLYAKEKPSFKKIINKINDRQNTNRKKLKEKDGSPLAKIKDLFKN